MYCKKCGSDGSDAQQCSNEGECGPWSESSPAPACSTATVPVDHAGNPAVTNEMKAECIGEFSWKEDWPYFDEDGVLHECNIVTHTVPWSVCKEIYKRMAKVAAVSR